MALIKISEDVIFSNDVLPICLPESQLFPDEKGKVYVAGWGSVSDSNYTTGKYGPNPYTLCDPNFEYDGETISGCSATPSPTSNDPLCQLLIKSKNFISFPEPGYTQTDIFDQRENILTSCYNFPINNNEGPYGWCSTCQKDANPGEPGYCGNNPSDNNEDFRKPTADKGWGFCYKRASDYAVNETLLNEVQLDLVSFEECKEMGSLQSDMLDIELCAAKQVCKIYLKLNIVHLK